MGIINRQRLVHDLHTWIHQFDNNICELSYCHFFGIAKVDWPLLAAIHECEKSAYQVFAVAKAACLFACAVDRKWFIL